MCDRNQTRSNLPAHLSTSCALLARTLSFRPSLGLLVRQLCLPSLGLSAEKRPLYARSYNDMESILASCTSVNTLNLSLHHPRPFDEHKIDIDLDFDTNAAQYQPVLQSRSFPDLFRLSLSSFAVCFLLLSSRCPAGDVSDFNPPTPRLPDGICSALTELSRVLLSCERMQLSLVSVSKFGLLDHKSLASLTNLHHLSLSNCEVSLLAFSGLLEQNAATLVKLELFGIRTFGNDSLWSALPCLTNLRHLGLRISLSTRIEGLADGIAALPKLDSLFFDPKYKEDLELVDSFHHKSVRHITVQARHMSVENAYVGGGRVARCAIQDCTRLPLLQSSRVCLPRVAGYTTAVSASFAYKDHTNTWVESLEEDVAVRTLYVCLA